MSKLVELLEKAGQQIPEPMGFGSAARRQKATPAIVLVARVLPEKLAKSPGLVEADADAFLVADDPAMTKVTATLKGLVWGVRSSEFTAAHAAELASGGCDYVVFESMKTEASLLTQHEELEAVVTVTGDHDEETVRALCDLPVGAALFGPGIRDLPMTVQTAKALQMVLGVLDKPLMAEAPEGMAQQDLKLLRDIGVAGLIVDLDTPDDVDKLAKIKGDIETLPRPRPRRGGRDALIPQTGPVGATESLDDDDDEEY